MALLADKPVLWHGSRDKIVGPLEPRQAEDVGGAPTSNLKAVYATPNKEFAIMMGMTEAGSEIFMDHSKKPLQMVLVSGKIRKGKTAYLYKLPSETFVDTHRSAEWVSKVAVTPIGVEQAPVNSHLHLK